MIDECFNILQIAPTKSFNDIKKAYKLQIFQWHPDRAKLNNLNPEEATVKSQEINKAFEYLKNTYAQFDSEFEKDASDFSINWDVRLRVESSNLDWVEYYHKLRILIVAFRTGGIYFYEDVPELIYNELIHSPSKGKYLHKNIAYRYPYHKLNQYDDWIDYAKKAYHKY
jgi:curved DNA-binding protein CbpA